MPAPLPAFWSWIFQIILRRRRLHSKCLPFLSLNAKDEIQNISAHIQIAIRVMFAYTPTIGIYLTTKYKV